MKFKTRIRKIIKRVVTASVSTTLAVITAVAAPTSAFAVSGFGPSPYKTCFGQSFATGIAAVIESIVAPTKLKENVYIPFWNKLASLLKKEGYTDDQIKGIMIATMGESGWAANINYENSHLDGFASLHKDEEYWASWSKKNKGKNGLGLAQWTDGRNTKLREMARDHGVSWQNAGVQMALFMQEINKWSKGKKLPKDMKGMNELFVKDFERPKNADAAAAQRFKNHRKDVEDVFKELKLDKGVEIDTNNADDVIRYAEGNGAENNGDICRGGAHGVGDNSSIAAAAVSLAYDPSNPVHADTTVFDKGFNRSFKATSLYAEIAPKVPNTNPKMFLASCDRGVNTALFYAGVDAKDLPGMGTANMTPKMAKNSNWEKVNSKPFSPSSTTPESLGAKPGDILVTVGNGHTFTYVGKEAAEKKFPGKGYDIMAASYDEHTMEAGKWGYDSRSYNLWRYKGHLNPSAGSGKK